MRFRHGRFSIPDLSTYDCHDQLSPMTPAVCRMDAFSRLNRFVVAM
jgi:hypothetical protein